MFILINLLLCYFKVIACVLSVLRDLFLQVLVSKTKIEGEEALRRLVVALNGLAGIAIIEQNFTQAVSLYKEALTLAEEHAEDFRLDPLLNIHIHHNLAEILPLATNCCPSNGERIPGNSGEMGPCDEHVAKRRKLSGEDNSSENGHASCSSFSDVSLRTVCDNIKQKYLSAFSSKLSMTQQEFKKSYTQVYFLSASGSFEQNKNKFMIFFSFLLFYFSLYFHMLTFR